MADTTFVDRVTPIQASWLNDVNDAVYSGTGVFTQAGTGAVARTMQAKLREAPYSTSDYSPLPTPTTPGGWYWDYTNPDSAGQMQLKQTIPSTVSMLGGAAVEGAGLIFSGSTSAQTPNAGLAETNMIRMTYTVNAAAGQKLQVHMVNGLLICEHDVGSSGNEGGVLLGTMRASGPVAGGSNVAMGVWGGDLHVEKTSGVATGKMVGLEVGVHSAVSQATGSSDTRMNGVEVWSGDRSGITAVRAHNAIDIFGAAGWENFFRVRHTDNSTEIFKLTKLGALSVVAPTGNQTTTISTNQATTTATLTVSGQTGASAAVNAILQAEAGGQVTLGSSTNFDVVMIANNSSVFRLKPAGQVHLTPRASAPTGGVAGDMYYDSTTSKHYGHNGAGWQAMY